MSASTGTQDPLIDRVQRLEEALAFAQHDHEQLSAEVLSLSKRLSELVRRMEAVERRSEAAAALKPETQSVDDPALPVTDAQEL